MWNVQNGQIHRCSKFMVDWGWEKERERLLMDTGFLFQLMKMFWKLTVQFCEYIKYNELYIFNGEFYSMWITIQKQKSTNKEST